MTPGAAAGAEVFRQGPRGHWLLGSAREFTRDQLGFYVRCAREYGDVVPVRLGPRRGLLIYHPDAIEEVLVTRARDFMKTPGIRLLMGDSCKSYTVDKGLAGGAPGAPATYVGMCHIFCDSVATFQAGFGPHAQEIMADIPNYTDLTPVIQISEVVVG